MNTNSSLASKLWLKTSTAKLKKAGIATARLDCLILLEDATGKDRSYLLAHPELVLEDSVLKKLNESIRRRTKHEPLAYIRGKSEFYGREFIVSADTLQPRPETETMVDLLKLIWNASETNSSKSKMHKDGPGANCVIVDVGTGSGCLGITAKLEFPEAQVMVSDISSECLKIAKQNAKKYEVDIEFLQGNLLQPLLIADCLLFIVLANLPYVPDSHTINPAAMFEPKEAIFGGPDGLDLYRRLFQQIAKNLQKPRYVFTESLPFQHEELARIALLAEYFLEKTEDFIQVFCQTRRGMDN